MISIGIDPGLTNAGLVVLGGEDDKPPEVLRCDVFRGPRQKGREQDLQQRLNELLSWVQMRIAVYVNFIEGIAVIECPMLGGRRDDAERQSSPRAAAETFTAWAGLMGLIRGQVAELYAPVPASWRAAVRPSPMGTEQLHKHLDRKWQITERVWRAQKLPHALDAAGLAEYGLQQHAARAAADGRKGHVHADREDRTPEEERQGQDGPQPGSGRRRPRRRVHHLTAA